MSYQEIPVSEVKIGMHIRIEMSWWDHPFLQNNFRLQSPADIELLKKSGIKTILFDPEKSFVEEELSQEKTSPPPSVSGAPPTPKEGPAVKGGRTGPRKNYREFLNQWQKKFIQKEREYGQAYTNVSKIINSVEANREASVQCAHEMLRNITDAFFQESDPMVYLINLKEKDDIAFFHSLNTCILSMMLGKALGISKLELKELGMGALFHDVGKLRIPKKVWMKKPPLTRAEMKYLELHPQYGVAMLRGCEKVSPKVFETIYQHHETRDGKGYPQKLTENQISLFAKIVAVVDRYDNICNQNALGKSLTPHETLSYIFSKLSGELSPEIIAAFVKKMGVYPPGTVVQLDDETIGMVITTDHVKSMKPTILLYSETAPREAPDVINLAEEEDVAITRSLHISEVAPEIIAYLQPGRMSGFFVSAFDPAKKAKDSNPSAS
jgi:HD-GYP domain-containing protein (c-di-GMP phosphodiesterase class II)